MRNVKLIFFCFLLLALTNSAFAQSKLHPSDKYWHSEARQVPVHISHLPDRRSLATVGDSIYMLDARNRVIWTWTSEGPPLTDIPIIDSKATIYAIGLDLIWVALDSRTGKEKWRGTASGGATYSQIKPYKRDMYLVVTNMGSYREKNRDNTIEDELTLCRGNSILWGGRIPAGARIEVERNNVYWKVRRKGKILRQEIRLPRDLSKPIGKVSTLADYE